jgi:hypothetical protein
MIGSSFGVRVDTEYVHGLMLADSPAILNCFQPGSTLDLIRSQKETRKTKFLNSGFAAVKPSPFPAASKYCEDGNGAKLAMDRQPLTAAIVCRRL